MTAMQVVALGVVGVGGTAVVLSQEPLRQTLLLGIFGAGLVFLFFVFQAPDVALSEIVVGTVGLPLIVVATLRKIAEQEHARDEEDT